MKTLLFVCFCAFSLNAFAVKKVDSIALKLDAYKTVRLTTDLSKLSMEEREGLKQLIRAAELIDEIFMRQAYGGNMAADTVSDPSVHQFMRINYGPWDRLDN